jgi:hypothetical protein
MARIFRFECRDLVTMARNAASSAWARCFLAAAWQLFPHFRIMARGPDRFVQADGGNDT